MASLLGLLIVWGVASIVVGLGVPLLISRESRDPDGRE